MAHNRRPEDFNAFGYNPHGGMANATALLFGENWRPNQADIPHHPGPQVGPPQFGPPVDYQQPYLPQNFSPRQLFGGYLGALQYQRHEGPWANYPAQEVYQPAQYLPHPPPNYPAQGVHQLAQYLPYPPPLAARYARASSPPICTLNNSEIQPGVYRVIAHLSTEKVQREFSFNSDIDYIDFKSHSCANLGVAEETAELEYHVWGQKGTRTLPTSLASAEDFDNAMQRITTFMQQACMKEYGIEVINLNIAPKTKATAPKTKKRSHEEDIPPEVTAMDALTGKYKKLANHTKCKGCKGHCHVMRNGSHRRLDYKEMSYWAKQNTLGNSDIYEPPDALNFNHRCKHAHPNASGSTSKSEIHVHNHFDGLQFGGSVLGNHSNDNQCVDPATSPYTPCAATPQPVLSSPSPFPLSTSFFEPSSSSPPPDLPGNTLDVILAELDKAYCTTKYFAMATTLLDAGLKTARTVIAQDVNDIISWTGLPSNEISILHEYAIHQVGLDHIGCKSIPSPTVRPDPNATGESESKGDSKVVDSSDIDGPAN